MQLYVVGRSCVLTRRNTLTPAVLQAAAAAAAAAAAGGEGLGAGVVILPRLSVDKQAAVAAAQQQQQQQQPQQAVVNSSAGIVLADASVQGDPYAPPLWAMQQLAAHLRGALGMSLFNVDIIVPSGEQEQGGARLLVVDINYFPGIDKVAGGEQLFADLLAECAGCNRA
jgi:hypothetical protein